MHFLAVESDPLTNAIFRQGEESTVDSSVRIQDENNGQES
jgi:hypothetical protein